MMRRKPNLFLLAGITLILVSCALVVVNQFRIRSGVSHCAELASRIEAALPPRSAGYVGIYSDPNMPVLELDGTDWCGILEVPAYGLTLPIHGSWDKSAVTSYPCRFWGSVYDGSMILGGSDQNGQFAFCSQTNPGDYISITDMLGNEFRYQVARVDRSDSADFEKLSAGEYPLTLFTRSTFGLEYIIVRCNDRFR